MGAREVDLKNFFKGAATALVTPFDGREVNYAVLEKLIARQIKAGIGALAVLGTTGEAATVTNKERREIFAFCVRIRNKYDVTRRTKLIFGCGANDTREAVKNTEIAAKLGADGVLCITPYCNKCTQRGLYEYYREICRATALPVIAYNVPSRTGVNILPETMEAIAELKNIAGIKDAGGNMAQSLETLRRIRRQCDLYSGADELNLPVLLCGGAGVISVTANTAPSIVRALCEAVTAGDIARAIQINELLAPLNSALFCEVNPIPVKAAMNLLGFFCGKPRAPLTEIENEHFKMLSSALTEFRAAMKNEAFFKDCGL